MDGGGLWLWRDDPEIRSGGKSISDVGGVNKWFLEAAVNTGRGGRIEKSRHPNNMSKGSKWRKWYCWYAVVHASTLARCTYICPMRSVCIYES